jgi:hypothetical protein
VKAGRVERPGGRDIGLEANLDGPVHLCRRVASAIGRDGDLVRADIGRLLRRQGDRLCSWNLGVALFTVVRAVLACRQGDDERRTSGGSGGVSTNH